MGTRPGVLRAPSLLQMWLSDRVRLGLSRKKWTVRELERRAHMAKGTIQHMLTGDSQGSLYRWSQILELLEIGPFDDVPYDKWW